MWYLDVFCTVIASMSPQKVCGSIAIEIPILWPRAVMVGPRPRVLLTPPLYIVITKQIYFNGGQQYNGRLCMHVCSLATPSLRSKSSAHPRSTRTVVCYPFPVRLEGPTVDCEVYLTYRTDFCLHHSLLIYSHDGSKEAMTQALGRRPTTKAQIRS